MVGHRGLLRLSSFTHPFWACLGGLRSYMPIHPRLGFYCEIYGGTPTRVCSARLSSGRIVPRVTPVKG